MEDALKDPRGQTVPRMQQTQPNRVPIRERGKAPSSRAKRALGTVAYTLWLTAFAAGGTFLGYGFRNHTTREIIRSILFHVKPEDEFHQDSLNILLLGCDEDLAPGGKKVLKMAGRADMILLAHLDLKNKTLTGISVARDTRTQLPGEPAHKLNAYHNLVPPDQAKEKETKAVEFVTGVKVDKTIELNYVAFIDLVDMVGGIDLTVKDKMDYDDNAGGLHIHFKPGKTHLDGYDAMGYVRFRHDKGGDYKRTERQRQLLMAFKSQVAKNWTHLPEIVGQGAKVLGEDTFTDKEIAALAIFSRGIQQKDIKMLRLPTHTGHGTFEELEKDKATKMLRDYGFLGPKTAEQPE